MEYDHMSFVEAIETLATSMGVEVPRSEDDRPAHRYDELFAVMSRIEKFWQGCLRDDERAIAYLREQRGIDGETARRYGIGYAPDGWSRLLDRYGKSQEAIDRLLACGLVIRKDNGSHYDRFRDRIMFPIRDQRGRTIGFGGRALGDADPKYLNSPETVLFHKGRELYGLFEARKALRKIDRLVVVEGYMDTVALARHGINFVVATLGTATTADHLNRLFRLTDTVVFCFDGDRAGKAAAWRALENALPQVREGRQIGFVFLPEAQDPDSYVGEFGAQAFIARLEDATALSDFLIQELVAQVDMTTVDGRARLAELAKPLLGKITPGVYRELLVASLAETVGLTPAKLERMFESPGETRAGSGRRGLRRARTSAGGAHSGRPSVVRRAITLLLNHPRAGGGLDESKLTGVERPGIDLLRALIETVKREPDITTAGLLERWRHDDEGRHLGKLAAAEIPDEEDFDAVAELEACLDRLAAAGKRDRVEYLIEKQRVNSLTDDERAELRRLH